MPKRSAKSNRSKTLATRTARSSKTPAKSKRTATPVPKPTAPPAIVAPAPVVTTTSAPTKPPPTKAAKKAPSLDHQRRQLLDTKTLSELKAMLKRNDQITTGTKPKLIKRIVECVARGCFPRCPSCGLGRLKIGSWGDVTDDGQWKQYKGFKCPGGYDDDEYMFCGFTAKLGEIERPPWQFETPGGLV